MAPASPGRAAPGTATTSANHVVGGAAPARPTHDASAGAAKRWSAKTARAATGTGGSTSAWPTSPVFVGGATE